MRNEAGTIQEIRCWKIAYDHVKDFLGDVDRHTCQWTSTKKSLKTSYVTPQSRLFNSVVNLSRLSIALNLFFPITGQVNRSHQIQFSIIRLWSSFASETPQPFQNQTFFAVSRTSSCMLRSVAGLVVPAIRHTPRSLRLYGCEERSAL